MPNEKSPFIGFTVEEIFSAEMNSYVIQIGNDFYNKDGNFVFSATQANKHYNILLTNILSTMDKGTFKQKTAALKCLGKLLVYPLRIQ